MGGLPSNLLSLPTHGTTMSTSTAVVPQVIGSSVKWI